MNRALSELQLVIFNISLSPDFDQANHNRRHNYVSTSINQDQFSQDQIIFHEVKQENKVLEEFNNLIKRIDTKVILNIGFMNSSEQICPLLKSLLSCYSNNRVFKLYIKARKLHIKNCLIDVFHNQENEQSNISSQDQNGKEINIDEENYDMVSELVKIINKEANIDKEIFQQMQFDLNAKLDQMMKQIYLKFIQRHLQDVLKDVSLVETDFSNWNSIYSNLRNLKSKYSIDLDLIQIEMKQVEQNVAGALNLMIQREQQAVEQVINSKFKQLKAQVEDQYAIDYDEIKDIAKEEQVFQEIYQQSTLHNFGNKMLESHERCFSPPSLVSSQVPSSVQTNVKSSTRGIPLLYTSQNMILSNIYNKSPEKNKKNK
ncbi:UNKNOWN [Stylonychia lemnae]|uniref:Uncharacterized protein n=1 Tax=Stylonychia lemnae TaxID=5949 RepID=A0A078AIJ9_STYLE|nr:UNKNOWN [Stylonychia lemnae]|eukprot:CDW82080.1 UNKNOWN [Stylonychia lemnae]